MMTEFNLLATWTNAVSRHAYDVIDYNLVSSRQLIVMPGYRADNSPRGLCRLPSYDRCRSLTVRPRDKFMLAADGSSEWGYNDAKHHNAGRHVGEEPGVNPHSLSAGEEYGHFKEDCVIDVIDYDSDDTTFRRMDNVQFIEFMGEKSSDAEALPPRAVRWINISGIDWDVLSATAVRYSTSRPISQLRFNSDPNISDLHALSLEDILHERGASQSKADYYLDHLFIRVVTHFLHLDGTFPLPLPDLALSSIDDLEQGSHQSSSPLGKNGQKKSESLHTASRINQGQNSASSSLQNSLARRVTLLSGLNGPVRILFCFAAFHILLKAREAHMREIGALKDSFVKVTRDPMFIFLRHDGASSPPNPKGLL